MGKRNTVYDEVLNGYLALRNDMISKERTAHEKIAEAKNSIENNSALMDEAVNTGDQDRFVNLHVENEKNKAIIEFFTNVLNQVKKTDATTEQTADELRRKANVEIQRIKQEYTKRICKELVSIVELSNDALLQVELLELAKNKILFNIEHKPENFRIKFNYNDIPMMQGLDQMLQNPSCIQEMKTGKVSAIPNSSIPIVTSRNNWDLPAKNKFSEEAAKWI